MDRSKIKYVVVGILILIGMYLGSREQIEPPGRAYPIEIYQQTGDLLIKEFGFHIPMEEFEITSKTDKAILVDDDTWILRGNKLINGALAPWKVKARCSPGALKATLLEIKSNGSIISPNDRQSDLEFDTDEHLKLRAK